MATGTQHGGLVIYLSETSMILLDMLGVPIHVLWDGLFIIFKVCSFSRLDLGGKKNLENAKYFVILQRFMFNSNVTNEPHNMCLIPSPFHVLYSYINHVPASSKVFLKSKIDYDWEYEQQVSHV